MGLKYLRKNQFRNSYALDFSNIYENVNFVRLFSYSKIIKEFFNNDPVLCLVNFFATLDILGPLDLQENMVDVILASFI